MLLMSEAIEYRRLRAPQADGGTLIEPPPASVGDLLQQNRLLREAATVEIAGRRLVDWSCEARRDLVSAARSYSDSYRDVSIPADWNGCGVMLAGHQPQLFHPGVWYKNFVLGRVAREHNAVAVNLVIDSDAMRTTSVRVPTGSLAEPGLEQIAIDRATAEMPYEERTIADPAYFASFAQRVKSAISALVPDAFIDEFWPVAVARSQEQSNLGLAISQARHVQEGRWNSATLELPQSKLGDFAAFHAFALHLLADAARFREIYNAAAADYRRINHIRSHAHPVPDLAIDGEWIEAPFWLWTKENPRRRRAFVRVQGRDLLVTDREGLEFPLAASRSVAFEQLAGLAARGIKLRTRALITTMFARLFLGDLFLHGVGGAKYDQVTDAIIRRFFGIDPPTYLTVTATLRLPIERPSVSPDDLRLVEHRLRELEFHPERSLDTAAASEAGALIAQKNHWVVTPQTRANARERCRAIRNVNETLRPQVARLRESLLAERASLLHLLRSEKFLGSREYAFCLYPAAQLRDLMAS